MVDAPKAHYWTSMCRCHGAIYDRTGTYGRPGRTSPFITGLVGRILSARLCLISTLLFQSRRHHDLRRRTSAFVTLVDGSIGHGAFTTHLIAFLISALSIDTLRPRYGELDDTWQNHGVYGSRLARSGHENKLFSCFCRLPRIPHAQGIFLAFTIEGHVIAVQI